MCSSTETVICELQCMRFGERTWEYVRKREREKERERERERERKGKFISYHNYRNNYVMDNSHCNQFN